MKGFRRSIAAIQGYTPGEQPSGHTFIKLNTNENPYPPSPLVIEAIHRAAGADLRLYPDPMATPVREVAARVYGLTPDRILVGNGSDELLTMLMRACVGPGDRVAYAVPTYSLYDTLVQIQEGRSIRIPFGDDFELPPDLGDTEAVLTIVCNPNSPSGTLVPLATLEDLATRVRGLLVVDEAYVDFSNETGLPLLTRHANAVILRTLSKSYSLAGMRLGLALGALEVIDQLRKVKDSYNVSRLAIAAGAAALEDQAWAQANIARVRATRARLTAELRALGFEVPDSHANFVLARTPGLTQEPTYRSLKNRGILVRYFHVDGLDDALRITVGTDEEVDALLGALRDIASSSTRATHRGAARRRSG